ncbi:MAG: glycosyltransferase [Crocinitomicaceae bacterium]|jgi:hypothetical protein|nr:glycosyltransferase [Crocinitomicaceae bacterium]MBT5402658.1 glycosyltransferase [Crocinitomicaceae bacterium]MBT6029066.1 glycosyltransferase [Crocinitomicaceae bacterium]MBT6515617.1 glycosyltransferase [Crocinitomicaceae bacterium]
MLVLVNGLPFFSKRIVADLNTFDSQNKYVFFNTYYSRWEQIKFLICLPFCSAVISFNGVSDNSNSLNWVLRLKKTLVMQWHGTDVSLAVGREKSNQLNRKYINHAKHLASAPWFAKELENVVSHVLYAPFGYIEQVGNTEDYHQIEVLTYLGEGNERFYGWEELRHVAKEIPALKITVIGSRGDGLEQFSNVSFLGWIAEEEVIDRMKKAAIFVRMTEHDGKAISVSQALSVGSEVIWSYAYDCCHQVARDGNSLLDKIVELSLLIEKRGMKPNKENMSFAQQHLLKDKVMTNYVSKLKRHLNE